MQGKLSFDELCERLATTDGGFTLWLGAGAAIALTNGATPGWKQLIDDIEGSHPVADSEHRSHPSVEASYPELLEQVSSRVGHRLFRRALRKNIITPIVFDAISLETVSNQATIGARANAIVSFNIEVLSAMSFVSAYGDSSFRPRTFREKHPDISGLEVGFQSNPGAIAPAVYFPHGLLNDGNLVITKSEYDLHEGSLAMATAIHLCLGSDLVIIGMSLADSYLRRELLKHRRWIRRVYWLGAEPHHSEWMRVARVTFVKVKHADVWPGLASRFIAKDTKGTLSRSIERMNSSLASDLPELLKKLSRIQAIVDQHAKILLGYSPFIGELKFYEFIHQCVDMGCDIPASIADHPRYKLYIERQFGDPSD